MTDERDMIARIRLARTPGIGPLTYRKLIQTYKKAEAAIDALPGHMLKAGRKDINIRPLDAAKLELGRTEKYGARIIFPDDEDFPALLKKLSPPPPILTVFGDLGLATKPAISMVGARNASAAGLRIGHDMAMALGKAGWVVVSGLARGLDAAAHKGALKSGTIAVIAGGIDNIYPTQNTDLYHAIAEKGLIVSENPFGMEPRAKHFPRRNRLITGLSLGVVVVEAAMKSGSLISARTALEQNREVMAVPGSPLDPRNKGSNGLIRSGATLVEDAEQVIDVLTPMISPQLSMFDETDEEDVPDFDGIAISDTGRDAVLRALSPVPVRISDIAEASAMTMRECLAHLMELELMGLALTYPGGVASRNTR